jgi:Protein of unknown function (DUF3221)
MRFVSSLLLVVVLAIRVEAQETKPDIHGSADKVTAANDAAKKNGILGSVYVEAVRDRDVRPVYDKAFVRVNNKTKIQKMNGKLVEDAKFEEIKNGVKLSVWFTGPVAESYPMQATAGKILIFPAKKEKE